MSTARIMVPKRAAGAIALALLALSCKDSNMVTAPVQAAPSRSLAGTWTGSFRPNSDACTANTASATFVQDGSSITGHITAASCGVSGAFFGTLEGERLTGRIEMEGCAGGLVMGTSTEAGLSLTIADLTRPLVTENAVVRYGGTASLHR
jgi:hypothetical protein